MPYPNKIERMKARERKIALQWDCKMGKHKWGPSASPEYEKCQYSWCEAIRKVEHARPGTDAKGAISSL